MKHFQNTQSYFLCPIAVQNRGRTLWDPISYYTVAQWSPLSGPLSGHVVIFVVAVLVDVLVVVCLFVYQAESVLPGYVESHLASLAALPGEALPTRACHGAIAGNVDSMSVQVM